MEEFREFAARTEAIFRKNGACDEGSIELILEGTPADCSAFEDLYRASERADGDVVIATREVILASIFLEDSRKHLEKIKEELIQNHHEAYTFVGSRETDQFGCEIQSIRNVQDGEAVVVGTRSDPECIEKRLVDVEVIKTKYHTTKEGRGSDVVLGTISDGEEIEAVELPNSINWKLAVPIILLTAVIAFTPAFVFRTINQRSLIAPQLSEYDDDWFGGPRDKVHVELRSDDDTETLPREQLIV